MEYINRNNENYVFVRDFKHNKNIRISFNALAKKIFGISFEEWYVNGFWDDNYIPYSLLHNNKVISNVSISIIDFVIDKKESVGIQIGTVMTDNRYRCRGLNKLILERVISEWKDKSDFIYLFANNDVLNFYPRFDFEIIDEFQHSIKLVSFSDSSLIPRKINIEDNKDKELLVETISMSTPISKMSMRNNLSLIMFHCLYFKRNNIYYIGKLKAFVIAEYEDDILYLNDVFSKEEIEIDDVIQFMSKKEVKRVVLGFTPLNEADYEKKILKQDDTTLFMLKDNNNYLKKYKSMFPVLSHT